MIHQHGGNIEHIPNILDFSANINPLGTPEGVRRAVTESLESIEKYPDPYCTQLRKKLAEHENVPAKNIVCGNGADDLIFRIAHALRPRKAVIPVPAFSEYSRALTESGCIVSEHILSEENGFSPDESLLRQLTGSTDICFICTPNNPTGKLFPADILALTAEHCRKNGIILVCDECFLDFVQDGSAYSIKNFMNENCIILKAFTKIYAIPGIRLGYAVCGSHDLAGRIQRCGQFWSVSSLAQCAGIAALDEKGYISRTCDYIEKERHFLSDELYSLGIKVYDSAANFLLFKSNTGLYDMLLKEGILIRDCRNFSGLSEGFFRTAVRTHDENIRLISALRRCIHG